MEALVGLQHGAQVPGDYKLMTISVIYDNTKMLKPILLKMDVQGALAD